MKIFQIGFNKCGTGSLHKFFIKNELKSIHYDSGRLAKTIFENFENDRDLLFGCDGYDAYSDMELLTNEKFISVAESLFKELYNQYPDSVFILNTRDVDSWVNSRLKHNKGTYLSRYRSLLDVTSDQIIKYWKEEYYKHISNVQAFFENKTSANFIHLRIDEDCPSRLGDYLSRLGYKITVPELPHFHQTKFSDKQANYVNVNYILDAACVIEEQDLRLRLYKKAYELDEDNFYCRNKISLLSKYNRFYFFWIKVKNRLVREKDS
ncbi:sulfotransferase [Agarivorans aestuarii]|uniref:Sulfotransferase n=1 Tax=Agarivorans aestuarii TaxID=1563703 RepID=A0ABU7G065_9ALTE|nr:sulfotransferase [Agarivorans aestuarii]MEE1672817.1 sulfotransferase [Agarivorans aestuarii]